MEQVMALYTYYYFLTISRNHQLLPEFLPILGVCHFSDMVDFKESSGYSAVFAFLCLQSFGNF